MSQPQPYRYLHQFLSPLRPSTAGPAFQLQHRTPLSALGPHFGAIVTPTTSPEPIKFDPATPRSQSEPRELFSPVRDFDWRSSTSSLHTPLRRRTPSEPRESFSPVRDFDRRPSTSSVQESQRGQSPLLPPDPESEMQLERQEDRYPSRRPPSDVEPRRSRSCDRNYQSFEGRNAGQHDQPRVNLLFSDASYAPPSFSGATTQDADRWLRRFEYYVQFRQMSDKAALQLFKLLLTEAAADWLESVPDKLKLTTKLLTHAFKERFASSDIFRWQQASAIFARKQADTEPVDTYITDILNLAKKVPIRDENIIRFALIKGFKPIIRQHVLQSSAKTLDAALEAARIAEAAATQCPADNTDVSLLSKDVRDLMAAFKELHAKARPPTPERVAYMNSPPATPVRQSSPRRVTFEDQPSGLRRPDNRPGDRQMPPPSQLRPSYNTPPSWEWPEPPQRRPMYQSSQDFRSAPSQSSNFNQWRPDTNFRRPDRFGQSWTPRNSTQNQFRGKQFNFSQFSQFSDSTGCPNCGRQHPPDPSQCFSRGLRCYGCNRIGHIRRLCRSTSANSTGFRRNFIPQQ